ncbi:ABC transporter permease [Dongia rigui]|uniref:Transport permease protein n=1 Tax=Dongia rigui TaxID=940149 RepID=A0ABU5DYN9_9PROT|nr:ABC transporter permease [Dongia rigui]MDY0872451.1 ABC transporter permease [Dongia rigui]
MNATLSRTTLAPRRYGAINWIGLYTLYRKEVRRFLTVATQTVMAPMVTTLLFLAVFVLAMGHSVDLVGGVPYMEFLAPGLIMMAMTQNAFANTSSSLMIAKIQGNIVDLLMPPLTAFEITLALALGGLTRGIVVGLATAAAIWVFVPLHLTHLWAMLFYAAMASLMLAQLGVVAGIYAEKFDHMAAVTNFIITPLAFLSGTFYSTERLPEFGRLLAHLNPFFYMIDGFRYGLIGHADGSLLAGVVTLVAVNLALLMANYLSFEHGSRMKP